jgi:hypothetical protein
MLAQSTFFFHTREKASARALRVMDIRKGCEVLELRPGYSPEELKQAYKDLAQVWHPDRFAHNPRLKQRAEAKLKQINQAYEILDQALVERVRLQEARERAYGGGSDEATVRAVYQHEAAWVGRSRSRGELQVLMVLWIVGTFMGFVLLIGLLVYQPLILALLLLALGSYFGLQSWSQRN